MPRGCDRYRIAPGARLDLSRLDPDDRAAFAGDKAAGRERLRALNSRLEELQEALYAEGRQRLLVVLQAMDTGGKDGLIRSVFDGVNPQGVRVHCFKRPTEPEAARDFLWRVHQQVPANGEIVIFNRSHYESVLVTRVRKLDPERMWRARFEHIVAFEQMLADEGTVIRKFFLHIGKAEQRQRLQERIDDPSKRWKFKLSDLEDRSLWRDYQRAYAEAIARTSTARAPWYVVPAERNWYRDLIVAEVLVATLEAMHIELPRGDPKVRRLRIK